MKSPCILFLLIGFSVAVPTVYAQEAGPLPPRTVTSLTYYPLTDIPTFSTISADLPQDEDNTAVTISLSHLPEVRIFGVLEGQKTGEQIPLVWDPLESPRLSYTVVLKPDKWRVTMRSDTVYKTREDVPTEIKVNGLVTHESRRLLLSYRPAWKSGTMQPIGNLNPSPDAPFFHLQLFNTLEQYNSLTIEPAELYQNVSPIAVYIIRQPTKAKLSVVISNMTASELRTATGRSFADTIPQPLADLFSIVAEIAFERAKAKSFQILHDRAVKLICEDLTVSVEKKVSAQVTNFRLTVQVAVAPVAAANEFLILPTTCETVRNLRIQELATSGKNLLNALIRDVAQLLVSRAIAEIQEELAGDPGLKEGAEIVSVILKELSHVVYRYASGQSSLTDKEVQSIFVSLAGQISDKLVNSARPLDRTKDAQLFSYAAKVSFGIIAACQERGGCDAKALSDYINKPEKFLDEVPQVNIIGGPAKAISLRVIWPGITDFIARGQEILRPSKAVAPNVQMRNVVNLFFELVEQIASKTRKQLTKEQKEKIAQAGPFSLDDVMIHSYHNIVIGILDRDVQPVLIGGSQLIARFLGEAGADSPGKLKSLAKFSALAGAVASYVQSYPTGNEEQLDAKQAKDLRDSRKKAVESLIDVATNRTERKGDWIVSLGILPGIGLVGTQQGKGTQSKNLDGSIATVSSSSDYYYTQLALPLGVAIQRLPPMGGWSWGGLHMQVSAIDLAQFVNFDSKQNPSFDHIHWADFVSIGAQAGFLLGTNPNALFFLGLDARYAPAMTFTDDSLRGVFRLGALFGYYVPFFDFN